MRTLRALAALLSYPTAELIAAADSRSIDKATIKSNGTEVI